jgi:hypothetical protein
MRHCGGPAVTAGVDWGRGRSEQGPTWAAYAACAVALLYALVSFYWALGGTAGIDTLGGSLEQRARAGDPGVRWLAGAAGVLKVVGAGLALALVRPWGRVVPRALLLIAAWAGAVVLVLYGGCMWPAVPWRWEG